MNITREFSETALTAQRRSKIDTVKLCDPRSVLKTCTTVREVVGGRDAREETWGFDRLGLQADEPLANRMVSEAETHIESDHPLSEMLNDLMAPRPYQNIWKLRNRRLSSQKKRPKGPAMAGPAG